MLWIKEVEMVESVDDLKIFVICKRNSNARFLKYSMRGLLQHWTESSIIPNSKKKKVSLEEQKSAKRGPFPSWRTDCSLDLRQLPGHWSQRFCGELCGPIHYWSPKWWYSGIRFEMGRNFINDENYIWWHLWKDCTNEEYESLRNSRPYWNCTIWRLIRRKLGPDYHRLKTMVKRSIEQDLTKQEFWGQKRKLWKKRRGQESGDRTACTKNSRILLAMENQRAAF